MAEPDAVERQNAPQNKQPITFFRKYNLLSKQQARGLIIRLNDKLIKFFTNIYLGPLFDGCKEDTSVSIQSHLKFLDPSDPYYGITSTIMFCTIFDIYVKANDLISLGWGKVTGNRPAIEIKEYFKEEYDVILNRYLDHQKKYNEVEGDYRQFKLDGSKTISNGMHLGKNEKPKFRHGLFWIPWEFSQYLVDKIQTDYTEKCPIEDDDELDKWVVEHSDILDKLKYSSREMVHRPEVRLGAVAVKSSRNEKK